MVLSLGFRVLGMTSNPALMQVTMRLTSSQVHFSGHMAKLLEMRLEAISSIRKMLTVEAVSFILYKKWRLSFLQREKNAHS